MNNADIFLGFKTKPALGFTLLYLSFVVLIPWSTLLFLIVVFNS
ncbi:hypothetical protein DOJK_00249 [Patescibacteria group bacterium]|nr:hypothetical protein DOJK_00249 [Patescibacteria group bacterium]